MSDPAALQVTWLVAKDLAWFVLGLGFMKAVVEPAATWLVDRSLRAALPGIYRYIDRRMARLKPSKATPEKIERVFVEALDGAGLRPTQRRIEKLVAWYDPRAAAARALPPVASVDSIEGSVEP